MQAKRFQAGTIAEAYEQIRVTLGDDAVIISTRQAVAPGMFGFGKREFVEVVAGLAENDSAIPLRPLVQDAAAHDLVRGLAERAAARREGLDVSLPQEPPMRSAAMAATTERPAPQPELAPPFLNAMAGVSIGGPFDVRERMNAAPLEATLPAATDEAKRPARKRTRTAVAEPTPDTSTSLPDRELLTNLAAGVQDLRALVQRLALDHASETVDGGPAALVEIRDRLREQGVASSVMLPLLDKVARTLAPAATAEAARQAVERRLAAALPAVVALDSAKRPATVFVVGPSGAGKTTTAGRLGLQLSQQGLRITVAGIDVDRAGAPQQLQAFGAAAGLPVRICYTPGELQALLASGEADVVIVDAPGHNGTRADRMAELNAFAQIARERTLLLTLPATMQGEDLLQVTRSYASAQPDGLLLTRCDETSAFGGVLSAVAQSGIGVAFTTHDDTVSEPARPGNNHALATSVLLGQWPERSNVAARGRRAG